MPIIFRHRSQWGHDCEIVIKDENHFLLGIILGTVTILWHHEATNAEKEEEPKKDFNRCVAGEQRQAWKLSLSDKDLEPNLIKLRHPRP